MEIDKANAEKAKAKTKFAWEEVGGNQTSTNAIEAILARANITQ